MPDGEQKPKKTANNMSQQKRLEKRYAWIEASLRYTGKFDKISYADHFEIKAPQISVDQSGFVREFNKRARFENQSNTCGHHFELEILRGKIHAPNGLPTVFIFKRMSLRDWLRTSLNIPFLRLTSTRRVDPAPEVVRRICLCIAQELPTKIEYQTECLHISPHTLIDKDGQLIVRSFNHNRDVFSDFHLSDITTTQPHDKGVSYVSKSNDIDWHKVINSPLSSVE